jgi:hypothetical protein
LQQRVAEDVGRPAGDTGQQVGDLHAGVVAGVDGDESGQG